jgi:hypothetical protein
MEMLYFRWLIVYVHEVPEREPCNSDKITKSQFQFVCNHSKHQESSSCEHLVQLPVLHKGSANPQNTTQDRQMISWSGLIMIDKKPVAPCLIDKREKKSLDSIYKSKSHSPCTQDSQIRIAACITNQNTNIGCELHTPVITDLLVSFLLPLGKNPWC